ncbi:hypothetical protein C4D60_Mb10t14830 [Musa balbisiana]|uniref:Uncharacterized protein n=1 Tax=Musa balbisiana TaxID=52838 RepID=A0A4V4H4T6_MUSBA|nr:hypothetical protein C4D60_Mb10t14830 [Musa balbisiana]
MDCSIRPATAWVSPSCMYPEKAARAWSGPSAGSVAATARSSAATASSLIASSSRLSSPPHRSSDCDARIAYSSALLGPSPDTIAPRANFSRNGPRSGLSSAVSSITAGRSRSALPAALAAEPGLSRERRRLPAEEDPRSADLTREEPGVGEGVFLGPGDATLGSRGGSGSSAVRRIWEAPSSGTSTRSGGASGGATRPGIVAAAEWNLGFGEGGGEEGDRSLGEDERGNSAEELGRRWGVLLERWGERRVGK